MILTIELTAEDEARLQVAARNQGVTPAEIVAAFLRSLPVEAPPAKSFTWEAHRTAITEAAKSPRISERRPEDSFEQTEEARTYHWVKQQSGNDCGVAALAMILSQPYAKVRAFFPDVERAGLPFGECAWYLRFYGCTVSHPIVSHKWAERHEVWPPEPFAPVHLCAVTIRHRPPQHHWVVMLTDGSVLDGHSPVPKRLSDYAYVNSVIGIWHKTNQKHSSTSHSGEIESRHVNGT